MKLEDWSDEALDAEARRQRDSQKLHREGSQPNSVVPQVVEMIGRAMARLEEPS